MLQLGSTALCLMLACISLGVVLLYYSRRPPSASLPLPPGPTPHGLMGNLRDIPTSNEAETYAKWAKTYGPVVHFRVLNGHTVVLNTIEAAIDLLDKRSSIYSDRPRLPMLNELMGWEWNMGLKRYGDDWRRHRRIIHSFLNVAAAKKYEEVQARTNFAFLRALLEEPREFWAHIRRATAATIMSVAYGIEVSARGDDRWVALAEESVDSIAAAGLPGTYLVDWLPILKYIPEWLEWLPGAKFKSKARGWRKLSERLPSLPFEQVQAEMRAGKAPPSVAAELLQYGVNNAAVPVHIAKNIAGVFYVAGVDTTASALSSFFLAMTLFPEKQKKAQAEIDAVIGNDRLPEFSDRKSLPYVDAVMLEVLRLFPVAPLNLPRRAMEEDEYAGMRIPKGSTVFTNIWAILRDARDYPEPEAFKPERFLTWKGDVLNPAVRDPRTVHFGLGWRVCSGIHFADASIWLAVATVLACFDIAAAKVERGTEIVPSTEIRPGPGLMACPVKFPCEITPRSANTKDLVFLASEQA